MRTCRDNKNSTLTLTRIAHRSWKFTAVTLAIDCWFKGHKHEQDAFHGFDEVYGSQRRQSTWSLSDLRPQTHSQTYEAVVLSEAAVLCYEAKQDNFISSM